MVHPTKDKKKGWNIRVCGLLGIIMWGFNANGSNVLGVSLAKCNHENKKCMNAKSVYLSREFQGTFPSPLTCPQ